MAKEYGRPTIRLSNEQVGVNEPVARFAIANNGVRLVACGWWGRCRTTLLLWGTLLAQQRLEIGAQQHL